MRSDRGHHFCPRISGIYRLTRACRALWGPLDSLQASTVVPLRVPAAPGSAQGRMSGWGDQFHEWEGGTRRWKERESLDHPWRSGTQQAVTAVFFVPGRKEVLLC